MNVLYICSYLEIFNRKLILSTSKFERVKINCHLITIDEPLSASDVALLNKDNIVYGGTLNTISISRSIKSLSSIIFIRRYIKRNQIQITHFSFATPYVLYAPFVNCKKVLSTRGSDVLRVLPALKRSTKVIDIILNIFFRISFYSLDAITSTSMQQVKKIKELYGTALESTVIRTGVDVDRISSANPVFLDTQKDIIFFPRYVCPIYNIELQVEAISMLPKKILTDHLFVFIKPNVAPVLDSEYLSKILSMIDHFNLSDKLLILEELSQENMFSLYKQSCLVVMCPKSDGTPSSALEAFAARTSVILGSIEYDSDLFANSTYKLKIDSPAELAQLISDVVYKDDSEMTERAFQKVSQLGNITIETEKMVKIYQSIV